MPEKIQISEYCAAGHPDRLCDVIVAFILDRYLELDRHARVALECQLKDAHCTLSGEVSSKVSFSKDELTSFVRRAIELVGYTSEYQAKFGAEHVICADDVEVTVHLSQQSDDIAAGVNRDCWGDQGICWSMATDDREHGNMPLDYFLARRIAQTLVEKKLGGLDVKTQVTVEDGVPTEVVVAIPLADEHNEADVHAAVAEIVGPKCRKIVNGTGRYVTHGPTGDCGTTGRKLVVDFYGGNARIGGGSPWGKDPTKADVTLNVLARKKALDYLRQHGLDEVHCQIACCIGRREITVSYFDKTMKLLETVREDEPASHVIGELGLDAPGYAARCICGLFGYEG